MYKNLIKLKILCLLNVFAVLYTNYKVHYSNCYWLKQLSMPVGILIYLTELTETTDTTTAALGNK